MNFTERLEMLTEMSGHWLSPYLTKKKWWKGVATVHTKVWIVDQKWGAND